jgi:hypothetical protein
VSAAPALTSPVRVAPPPWPCLGPAQASIFTSAPGLRCAEGSFESGAQVQFEASERHFGDHVQQALL